MDLLDCCTRGDEVDDDTVVQASPEMFDVMALEVNHLASTPLFDAIVRNDWDSVDFFLESGTFSFSPFQESDDDEGGEMAATEDQVETWIVCNNDNGKLVWRQLPIHAAICYGAPINTVRELVKTYPAGLCCADTNGNLPVHLAVKFNRSEDILSFLLKSFPEGFRAENGQGRTPLQCYPRDDDESKERYRLRRQFIKSTEYLSNKECELTKRELDEVTKSAERATADLAKAQREVGLLKRFQIPRLGSRRDGILSWTKLSSERKV